ncbi:MAG: hypothetical protein ACFE8B_01275 [Candidatus Hermodarchaeota archaeon]
MKLEELEQRKKALKPKIDEINVEREREIQNVNKKYDHIIDDINFELNQIEFDIFNKMIESFINVVTRELEVKRSSSLYTVTDEFKEYRTNIAKLKMFPEDLIKKLDKVINGNPIEDVIYILDDIKSKYLKNKI